MEGSGVIGGGISIEYSKDTKGIISNCVFNNNEGGAIFAGGNGEGWIITNCLFNNNSNEGQYASGGAIYAKANTLISDCVFNNNDSTKGGAIGIENYTTIINCNFNYNSANNGGAIYDFSNNNTVIRNCNFKDNVASSNGDNVYNANSNSLKIYNCHISTGLYNTVNYDGLNSEKLVTSWSSTLSDTNIPSEKLVKDTIDGLDIPTKISDLTNDSDFIETSSTSGLIKNDGSIDTTSYATAQTIINYASANLVAKTDVANNLTTTTEGKVLDARQGKALADLIGQAIQYINL